MADFAAAEKKRSGRIDLLKGIAMVSVVLYHAGTLRFGYLGVDLFLVINGFLITGSILRAYERGSFSYVRFMLRRISRLWPPVLIAGGISLILGYFTMLPDDYENLGEAAVASNVFLNNFLAAITTKNYWDVSQEFAPLMHTWYLGIVMQFYAVFPLIAMAAHKFSQKFEKTFLTAIILLSAVSLALYVITGNEAARFYYLPFRFFEFGLGGILAFDTGLKKSRGVKYSSAALIPLVILMWANSELIPAAAKLILVCLASFGVVLYSAAADPPEPNNKAYSCIAAVGTASYSIFIWHQVIFAFYRYCINGSLGTADRLICLAATAAASALSYRFIENGRLLDSAKMRAVFCLTACIASSAAGLLIYAGAGVVRDIPELDIYKSSVHRGMHAEYCDRIYSMDVDFSGDDRIKVFICGDSFTRDWANVLLESDIADGLDIAYTYPRALSEKDAARISTADYIFVNAYTGVRGTVPELISRNMKQGARLIGIGTKRFGSSNGNVYAKRFRSDYYTLEVSFADVREGYLKEKEYWGNDYIDFIKPVMRSETTVSAFTDDNRYISQDCRHLTRAGAQYYARLLQPAELFGLDGNSSAE